MSILILGAVVLVVIGAMAAASRPIWRTQGHRTRVALDDFVVGDLPMICARTGRPADGLVEVDSRESAFQGWWLLLLLAGPFGIVAIALLWAFSPRLHRVGGFVPMTHDALDEQNRAIGWANWAGAIPVIAFLAGAALLAMPGTYFDWLPGGTAPSAMLLLLVALLGGFVVLAVSSTVANRRRVSVVLDGSGRWVELRNVHTDFARAVNRQVRERHAAGRPHTPR